MTKVQVSQIFVFPARLLLKCGIVEFRITEKLHISLKIIFTFTSLVAAVLIFHQPIKLKTSLQGELLMRVPP